MYKRIKRRVERLSRRVERSDLLEKDRLRAYNRRSTKVGIVRRKYRFEDKCVTTKVLDIEIGSEERNPSLGIWYGMIGT